MAHSGPGPAGGATRSIRCALLTSLVLLAAGCSRPAPPNAGLPPAAQAPATPAPPQAADLRSIGIAVGSSGDPFSDAVARGAEAEARALNPAVAVRAAPGDGVAARQALQIESLIDQHVDLIVLTPAEPAHLSAALRKAQKAGIVVVAVGHPAVDANGPMSTGESGESACRAAVAKLDGRGDVVIVEGPIVPIVLRSMQRCVDFLSRSPEGFADETASETPSGTVTMGVLPKIDTVLSISQKAGSLDDPDERTFVVATAEDAAGVQATLHQPGYRSIEADASRDPSGLGRLAVRLGLAVKRDASGGGT